MSRQSREPDLTLSTEKLLFPKLVDFIKEVKNLYIILFRTTVTRTHSLQDAWPILVGSISFPFLQLADFCSKFLEILLNYFRQNFKSKATCKYKKNNLKKCGISQNVGPWRDVKTWQDKVTLERLHSNHSTLSEIL